MLAYRLLAYAVFLAVFAYFVGWVEGLVVPRGIDDGTSHGPVLIAALVDVALLSVFALQHSVMARPSFKRRWTRIVPKQAERSTYVVLATATLALVMWQWRPIPEPVWELGSPAARLAVYAVSFGGWALVLASTFAIDHFHLFGLREREPGFAEPLLYRVVRHPLYLGFLVAFWAAPTMSWGRLLFAAAMTGYVLVAVRLEERDLVAALGDRYGAYRARTPMLVPRRPRTEQP